MNGIVSTILLSSFPHRLNVKFMDNSLHDNLIRLRKNNLNSLKYDSYNLLVQNMLVYRFIPKG